MAGSVRTTAICLLRNDLRVHDNEAIATANRLADHVIHLYCFDPNHYKGTWHFGFPKTNIPRAKFLVETVADLRYRLRDRGSDLWVARETPARALQLLVDWCKTANQSVSHLVYQREVTYEELEVENRLDSFCNKNNIKVVSVWGSTLFHVDDIPFKRASIPDTYTQFRKEVESRAKVRPEVDVPVKLRPSPSLKLTTDAENQLLHEMLTTVPTLGDLGLKVSEDQSKLDPRTAFPFTGGETTGLERLRSYLWTTDAVATYKETRNGLVGSEYSTKFSPWLALGCLSPRRIYHELKKYEKERVCNQSTYWVVFEMLWRDYFRFVGRKFGDRIFYKSGIMGKSVDWSTDKQKFMQWAEGRTGVPFVDANMRELKTTGWMSNRGRQNVASYLIKDLGMDWRLGAEWFESYLLDHDVCSNYGNWNYAAGIGNDPRENRKFNMVKQGLDYDPDGKFVRLWVPELAGLKSGKAHVPWALNQRELETADIVLGQTYPKPLKTAPEWSSHIKKMGADPNQGGGRGGQKGIDFYFKSDNKRERTGPIDGNSNEQFSASKRPPMHSGGGSRGRGGHNNKPPLRGGRVQY